MRVEREKAAAHKTIALALLLLSGAASLAALVNISVKQAGAQQTDRPRRVDTSTVAQSPAPRQTPSPGATPAQSPAPSASPTPDQKPKLRDPASVLYEEPPTLPNPAAAEIDNDSVVKIDTSMVNLNIRVVDRHNRPIRGIKLDEFKIFENGQLQKLELVSEEEVPISYGLAIDNSGSLRSQLPQVIDAAKIIITSNKRGDETFLMRFVGTDQIETVQDFTSDIDTLIDGIETFRIEGGQTAVIDAIYLASQHVGEYRKNNNPNDRRRRALIVVTDGEDRVSYYNETQLFGMLREEDVQIFVIGFVNELERESSIIKKSPRQKAVDLINRLASETGGRAFFPNSLSELPGIAAEITRDLRTQYVVSYYPANKRRDGTYRAIKVNLAEAAGAEKRIAITRPGYYAERETENPAKPQPKPGAPAVKQTGQPPPPKPPGSKPNPR